MDLTTNQQSPQLIEPPLHNRRRTFAIVVIFIVVISLLISIFTQPYLNPNSNSLDIAQTQQGGNITNGLVWVGQIAISFIALLSSIAELTGVSIRDFFGLRTAKTNVEDFPFFVFQDYDKLMDYLFPDPKTPLLPDREIKYFPQVSDEVDTAFQGKGMILIRGKSKTGKTREACEMLRRWWYSGPTVLVVRSHVGLYPPFKVPENLPLRNLVLFFDDIDRYLGDLSSLKRLNDTLQYFQDICHDRGELRVIATARQEEEFWKKLKYDQSEVPWNKFELIHVNPLSSEKAVEIIAELSKTSDISVEPDLAKILAEKNNGTFLNLVLAFRSWLNQKIKTVTSTEVKAFEGSLLNTWRHRYEEIATLRSGVKPIYAAINLLQAHNITLYPSLISELATEMGLKKWILSTLGVMDRIQNWLVMSPKFNWYRDPKRRHIGWIAILVTGIFLLYLFLYAFLFFIPVGTLLDFFEQLPSSLQVQLICLSPLWIFVVPFGVYFLLHIFRNIVFRQTHKNLELLLATEIPLRSNELRPYENQVEGNGSTINWPISSYDGKESEKIFPSNASHRLANRYLSLAEQLRLNGEFSSARKFASLAQNISNNNPAPLFMLGKIELDDGNLQPAIQFLNSSETLYGKSCNKSYAQERLALCHLLTGEYESAEKIASEALAGISDLVSARWVLGLAQLKQEKTISGKENCKKALRNPIPGEIQEAFVKTGLDRESWLTNNNSTILTPKKNHSTRWHNVKNVLAILLSFSAIAIIFFSITNYVKLGFDQEKSQSRLALSNFLITVFPNSPILYVNRGADYAGLGEYDKTIADYTEAVKRSPDADIFLYIGNYYIELNDNENALANYTEAIRLDPEIVNSCYSDICYTAALNFNPNDAQGYQIRGYAYYGLDNYEKALADLSEALRIDPEYSPAYYSRGLVYYRLGEYEQAVADYTEVINLGGDDSAHFQRGLSYIPLRQYDKALDDLSESLRIKPDAYVYTIRGLIYYDNIGNSEEAIVDFTKAIRLSPSYAFPYFYRGNVHYGNRESERAIADYKEAIRLAPQFAGQCRNLACFTAAINIYPNDAQTYKNRGDIYFRSGEYQKAVEDYTEAIHAHINHPSTPNNLFFSPAESYYIRGESYNQINEYEKAVADYTEAIRLKSELAFQCKNISCFTAVINLNPNDPIAYKKRGDFYHQNNNAEKAIFDYIEAFLLDPKLITQCTNNSCAMAIIKYFQDPGDANAFISRANAYQQLGELEKAGSDYGEAIRLDPGFADSCFNPSYCKAAINFYSDPQSAIDYKNRGLAHLRLGEYEKAIVDLTEAIRLDPVLVPAYYYRGNSYNALNDQENAIIDYTKAIQLDTRVAGQCSNVACYTAAIHLNSNDARTLSYRGAAYYSLGEYDLAMNDWNEAFRIASSTSDQSTLSNLQDTLRYWISNEAKVGRIVRALEWLLKIDQSAMSPNANTLNSVCWFGSLWGHARQVLGTCEQAVLLEPNNADIRDSRGLARALTGDFAGAILDFQYFVDHSFDTEAVGKRKLWIPELQKGNNPFTPQVLESLK